MGRVPPTEEDYGHYDRFSDGSTALVTGASLGIGAAFAEALAARVRRSSFSSARSEVTLTELAGRLRVGHGVPVRVIGADLLQGGRAPDRVADTLRRDGLEVDVLREQRGLFGTHGRFDTFARPAVHTGR
jgi:short-subunit dehydrogenase